LNALDEEHRRHWSRLRFELEARLFFNIPPPEPPSHDHPGRKGGGRISDDGRQFIA